MLALKIRLAKEFGILPSEIGKRLTAKDVSQILAFEHLENEVRREAERTAELESKARDQRSKVLGNNG